MMSEGVNAKGQREPGYRPPTNITTTTLGRFLAEAPRAIPDKQQARFGFLEEKGSKADGIKLWLAGDASLIRRPGVAIVGTRKVSVEGARRARRLAKELVEAGVVVVSGLAEGVDAHALTSAVDAGGKTIAVIGTPLDRAFPAANKRLQERIYTEHLLVSQFEPKSFVHKGNFPTRNKLMAAISDATVIIEAGETSGTLHQAAECARLGRPLFIAKSVVTNASLTWPASFLGKPGVYVLEATSDILDRLGGGPCPSE